jgi:hypothetical protein
VPEPTAEQSLQASLAQHTHGMTRYRGGEPGFEPPGLSELFRSPLTSSSTIHAG